jgi:hypothetical protein
MFVCWMAFGGTWDWEFRLGSNHFMLAGASNDFYYVPLVKMTFATKLGRLRVGSGSWTYWSIVELTSTYT